MAKVKLFPSPLDGCLQEHCEGQVPFFAPVNSCCARMRKSAAPVSASTYPAPAVAMSLKHLIASRVCQMISQPYVVLHSVSRICSSQSIH